jgi:TRAP-type C4-dicarboxylate transport system permease small subunit
VTFRTIGSWLYKRAENILVFLLAVMFVSFIIQIAFRYLFNFPIGWTSEMTVITWLWLVLWGAAFVVREDEEIRFDLIYGTVSRRTRKILATITALVLLATYIFSYPAVFDYVTFMKVQDTAYLKIRFDILYSIYLIFAAAVIARYAWLLYHIVVQSPTSGKPSQSDPAE